MNRIALAFLASVAAIALLFTIVFRKLRQTFSQPPLRPHRGVPLWYDPRRAGVACLLYLAWLLAIGYAPPAAAQVTPTTLITLSNLPTVMAGGTSSNMFTNGTSYVVSNNIIALRQGQGFAYQILESSAGTNALLDSNGFAITWATCLDGTNWCVAANALGLSNQMPKNTAGITGVTNLVITNNVSGLLNNLLFVTPYSLSNSTTNPITNKITVGIGNVVPGAFN